MNEVSGPTAGTAETLSSVPSRVNTIELDDWILAVSIEKHGKLVGSVESNGDGQWNCHFSLFIQMSD